MTTQRLASRISRISGRIAENENKGRLTGSDAKHLRGKLQTISNLLDSARKDSVIDQTEATKIRGELNALSDQLKQRGIAAASAPVYGTPSFGAPAFGAPTFGATSFGPQGFTQPSGYDFGTPQGAPTYQQSWGYAPGQTWNGPVPAPASASTPKY